MLLFGYMPNDIRVKKMARSISSLNYSVDIISHRSSTTKLGETIKIICQYKSTSIQTGSELKISSLLSFWIFSISFMFKTYKKNNPDFIYANDFTTLIPAITIKLIWWRTKIIYDSHELAPELSNEYFGLVFEILTFILEVTSIPFLHHIISSSPYYSLLMHKRYSKKITTIVNLPSLTDIRNSTSIRGEEILSKYIDNFSRFTLFIYAGHITINRGYERLISVWNKISEDDNQKILLLAGDGPKKKEVLDLAGKNKSIIYLGYLDTVDYYSLLRVINYGISLLNPNKGLNNYYGFPNKIPEYLVFNKKVVATKMINFKNEIREKKIIGVEYESEEDLYNKILTLESKADYNNSEVDLKYVWESQMNILSSVFKKKQL